MNYGKGTYGVHWREINRAGFVLPREKFFQTEQLKPAEKESV